MKILIFKILFFLALYAAVAAFLVWGDAYLLIAYHTYTVDGSMLGAVNILIFIGVSLWVIKRIFFYSFDLARNLRELFMFGSVERAQKRAASGMVNFLIGDWLEGRKKLVRTVSKVEYPLANYIAAARCCFEMGDESEAFRLLDQARKEPESELPISLIKARMLLVKGKADEALVILKPLQISLPKHAAILDVLHHVYFAQENWAALRDLFPQLRKAKVLSNQEVEELEIKLAIESLKSASVECQKLLVANRLPHLQLVWGGFTRAVQKNPQVVYCYAQALVENKLDEEAEVVLRKSVSNHWHRASVDLYGRLQIIEVYRQLKTLESWQGEHQNDAVLLLAIGRIHLRHQQRELARDFFNRSILAQKSLDALLEMARLLEQMGDHKRSAEYYEQTLSLAQSVVH
jgi:HemY protein